VADGRLSTALKVRYRLTPWWLKVTVIFVLSRVITTSLMLEFAAMQGPSAWAGPRPNYFEFAQFWDSGWYNLIAVAGYPSTLPLTADGHVGESAWAFMPAYPAVVRLVMTITTLGFPVASVLVSLAFAFAAALMFYRVTNLVLPSSTALFSVVLFCTAPLSPIFQVAYAESMHAFLLAFALYLLMTRRYWVMMPVIAVMALTRPSGLAFALAMAAHVVYRWVRRAKDPFPAGERVASVVVGLFSAFMGIAWLLLAWAFTGSPTAYTDTELAWRMPYIGYVDLVPFTPWFQAAGFWAPRFGMPVPLLTALLVLLVLGFAALLFTPAVKRLGPDQRFWLGSYALYLLAVFFPQSSTFRLLVPMFPLLGAVAQPRALWYRIGIVMLFILGQVVWIYVGWWVNGTDWTPP
jgi:hypothetical protein